jgi:hypothetical protein
MHQPGLDEPEAYFYAVKPSDKSSNEYWSLSGYPPERLYTGLSSVNQLSGVFGHPLCELGKIF